MARYEVPGIGEVIVEISQQEFFQPGYVLKSIDSVRRVDGAPVTADTRARVEEHLRSIGAVT